MFFVFYCKGNFCQENFPKWFRHAISYELILIHKYSINLF